MHHEGYNHTYLFTLNLENLIPIMKTRLMRFRRWNILQEVLQSHLLQGSLQFGPYLKDSGLYCRQPTWYMYHYSSGWVQLSLHSSIFRLGNLLSCYKFFSFYHLYFKFTWMIRTCGELYKWVMLSIHYYWLNLLKIPIMLNPTYWMSFINNFVVLYKFEPMVEC